VNLEPAQTIPDLQAVIEHAILNAERSLQTTIGPSSLGTGCDRCLITELAGLKPAEERAPWLPTIGNAVHEWLEAAVVRHLMTSGTDRYIPEGRVLVGHVDGQPIHGNSDLFDVHTGTVVDYKVTGTTTLRKCRSKGPSITYQRQAHLYGKGWEDMGFTVNSVAIWFLPRNGFTIDNGFLWQVPYDRANAEATLARANALAAGIRAIGAEQVLASAAPHTGDEFSCPTADEAPKTPDAFLGIG